MVISGLRLEELYIGDTAIPVRGARVAVRHTGYLKGGDVFESPAMVHTFAVGERNTMAGLSCKVEGTHIGVRRPLRVGPDLA